MKIEEIVKNKIKDCENPWELIWVLSHIDASVANFKNHYKVLMSYNDFVKYAEKEDYTYKQITDSMSKKTLIRALKLDRDALILICNIQCDSSPRTYLLNDKSDFKWAKVNLVNHTKCYNWDDVNDDIFDI